MELATIYEPILEEMGRVEEALQRITSLVTESSGLGHGRTGILNRIVRHPFAIPGKRIRPALVLLASRSTGVAYGREPLVQLAAAAELLHAASLIHDDVIDGSDTRRHQVSLNKRFGNRIAVLAGDILYTHFFSLITGLASVGLEKRLAILEVFLDTTKAMCMGEILAQEAGGAGSAPLELEDYLTITRDKTAVLFSACCRTAAMVSDAGESAIRALDDFGLSFGLVFQIVDDLADGDYRLDPAVDLKQKARECAEKAMARTEALPPSVYREKLRDLTRFVLQPAVC